MHTRLHDFILGIGLATGAPDTHPAATFKGSPTREFSPPVGYPTGGFVFLAPEKMTYLRNAHMNYTTYYRFDLCTAWRFISRRSGQPAASERTHIGGTHELTASLANCRTPQ
jgi:hypothetical protein